MPKTKSKNKQATAAPKAQGVVAARGTKTAGASAPSVSYKTDGSCTVVHKEYVGDMDTTLAGTTQTFALNPQNTTVFTWLTAIATRFEMYRFKTLKFHYRPSCGTTNEGYVILGFDFDAYDDAPTKNSILAWKYSSKAALWQSTDLDVSTDSRISTFRYCDVSSRGDARLDLLGNLFVLAQAGTTISAGEIYVSYAVEFRQPSYKIPSSISAIVKRGTTVPFMPSASDYFSPIEQMVVQGNALLKVINPNTLQLQSAGKYLLDAAIIASTTAGIPFVTFTQPAGSPSSVFTHTIINQATQGQRGIASYLLDVSVPPVNMTFAALAGTSGSLDPIIRLATYFASLT